MKLRCIFVLLLCLCITLLHAQVKVKGTVRDQFGNAISKVYCIGLNSQGLPESVSSTDSLGNWQLTGLSIGDSLRFSHLGYKTRSIELDAALSQIKSIEIQMEEKLKILDSVTITAERVQFLQKGDTITFPVTSYLQGNAKTLKDVINNIPGLQTDESGNISYNGKVIDKILIDQRDVATGITKSILNGTSSIDLDNIQIYENYKDDRDLFSKMQSVRTALNINTKKENAWHWTPTLFASIKNRYSASLLAFKSGVTSTDYFTLTGNSALEPIISTSEYLSLQSDQVSSLAGIDLAQGLDAVVPISLRIPIYLNRNKDILASYRHASIHNKKIKIKYSVLGARLDHESNFTNTRISYSDGSVQEGFNTFKEESQFLSGNYNMLYSDPKGNYLEFDLQGSFLKELNRADYIFSFPVASAYSGRMPSKNMNLSSKILFRKKTSNDFHVGSDLSVNMKNISQDTKITSEDSIYSTFHYDNYENANVFKSAQTSSLSAYSFKGFIEKRINKYIFLRGGYSIGLSRLIFNHDSYLNQTYFNKLNNTRITQIGSLNTIIDIFRDLKLTAQTYYSFNNQKENEHFNTLTPLFNLKSELSWSFAANQKIVLGFNLMNKVNSIDEILTFITIDERWQLIKTLDDVNYSKDKSVRLGYRYNKPGYLFNTGLSYSLINNAVQFNFLNKSNYTILEYYVSPEVHNYSLFATAGMRKIGFLKSLFLSNNLSLSEQTILIANKPSFYSFIKNTTGLNAGIISNQRVVLNLEYSFNYFQNKIAVLDFPDKNISNQIGFRNKLVTGKITFETEGKCYLRNNADPLWNFKFVCNYGIKTKQNRDITLSLECVNPQLISNVSSTIIALTEQYFESMTFVDQRYNVGVRVKFFL